MARSRAIDTRLERLVPAMEEYFVKGVFTQEQLRDISRQRTNHEYKLVARPLLYVDVRRAIDFELELEAQVARFLENGQVHLKHRNDIVDRVAHIFQIAIPCFEGTSTTTVTNAAAAAASNAAPTDRDVLEKQYLKFLRDFGRSSELSRYLAGALQKSPSNITAWVFSVEWELEKGNVDNARSIAQEALKHVAAFPKAWAALIRVETSFVSQLCHGVVETDKSMSTKQKKKKQEKKSDDDDDDDDDEEEQVDDNDDDENQQQEERAGTVSSRFAATNPPLAKIVLDGQLIVNATSAAVRSRAFGADLCNTVADYLLGEHSREDLLGIMQQRSSIGKGVAVSGRHITRTFINALGHLAAQSATSSSSSSSGTIRDAAVALNIGVTAAVQLTQAAWTYFFSSPAFNLSKAIATEKKSKQHNNTKQQQNRKNDDDDAENADENKPEAPTRFWTPTQMLDGQVEAACSLDCARSVAAETFSALVSLSRSTSHPLAAKAALQFAQRVVAAPVTTTHFNRGKHHMSQQTQHFSFVPQDDVIEQLLQIKNNVNSATTATTATTCQCQSALRECLADVQEAMQAAPFSSSSSSARRSASSNSEFSWESWVGGDFATSLVDAGFAISAIVPALDPHQQKNQDGAAASSSSSSSSSSLPSSLADLEVRARRFFTQRSNSSNNSNSNNSKKRQQQNQTDDREEQRRLVANLESWFNSMRCKNSKSSKNDVAKQMFSSDAATEQNCTLLLCRALLISRNSTNSQAGSGVRRRSSSSSSSSSSDDDDDYNNKTSSAAPGHSGFLDAVQLFKFMTPSTPTQLQSRAQCIALVASVWIELLVLEAESNQQQQRFPFQLLNLSATTSPLKSRLLAVLSGRAPEVIATKMRFVVDQCTSVFAPSSALLVDIAAGLEFALAIRANRQPSTALSRSQAETRMRGFFEAAVAHDATQRSTWTTWRQFEQDLGNLKLAGDVQRRGANAVGDSRL